MSDKPRTDGPSKGAIVNAWRTIMREAARCDEERDREASDAEAPREEDSHES